MINHDEAQYTILLSDVVRGFSMLDFDKPITDTEIEIAIPKIFNFNYPFDSDNKEVFEYAFILNFLDRELCTTPIIKWQLALHRWLVVNGKKWNKLLNAEKIAVDWSKPVNITEKGNLKEDINFSNSATMESTNKETNQTKNSTNTETVNIGSEFPQATLNGKDYANDSSQGTSESTDNTDYTGTNTSDGTSNTRGENSKVNDNTVTRTGNNGTDYGLLYNNYKDSVNSVLEDMFSSMSELFYSILI